MKKVVKFGGSSLASAEQFKKVGNIIRAEESRRYVVPSAPGKRFSADTKVTDMLYGCYAAAENGEDFTEKLAAIKDRYQEIIDGLGLKFSLDEDFEVIRKNFSEKAGSNYAASRGEFLNGKIMAAYLGFEFIDAAEVVRFDENGDFQSEITNEIMSARLEKAKNAVIPGFYGATEEGRVVTFSRGGSDITGSIVAAGVKADLYENFTDVDGIFAAHPGVVHEPHSIPELTYKEMRELAYAGFSVLHDEALLPAYRGKIPLVIKNTNNPDHPGTRIILEHKGATVPVVGIASDDKFVSINMTKYLMNREVGFGRKVLQILEDLNIRWEHMPSGIDDLSIIIRERELTPIKEQEILSYLTRELGVDEVEIEHGLSILMIVGENMKDHIGVTATAAKALSEKHINLEMISQGSSEVSVMFVIETEQEKAAVRALYDAFFRSGD